MLNSITKLPTDKRIARVHCISITENGTIVMAWDKVEQLLTTLKVELIRKRVLKKHLNVRLLKK